MSTGAHGLTDRIIQLIDDDGETFAEESKYLVLAALDSDEALVDALRGVAPPPPAAAPADAEPAAEPVGAFLRSISVSGFRGIGPSTTVVLHAAPGLTVVAGRNGAGKSTYAEALEVALTATSHRWRTRSVGLERNWANLHTPRPRQIRVGIAEQGVGTTTVGVDWPDDSDRFDDLRSWVQRPGRPREPGLGSLGWAGAIELYRPILSYEELGGLLTAEPSKLYDALVAILGLERVIDAQKRLDIQFARAAEPSKNAKSARTQLKKDLVESTDDRATQASALLRKQTPDLVALRALATGATPPATGTLARLHALAALEVPTSDEVAAAVEELRLAVGGLATRADAAAETASRRLALLRYAVELRDAHSADLPCPVCGQGTLDGQWRAAAVDELAASAEETRLLGEARTRLTERRAAVEQLVTRVGPIEAVPGVELSALARAAAARSEWSRTPADHTALADHVPATAEELRHAVTALRAEADAAWRERQDAWAPLATRLGAWLELDEQARRAQPEADQLERAKTWLRSHAEQLRNQLIEPLAQEARDIWAALRQDSNVDLGSITLPSTATRRHVDIAAEVDGVRTGALGVMSTGELHALALALFLPRATRPESPFRFAVLDDPIQAMDPSKIDGFVKVLADLAKTRQIVVFSHDDRLPEAVRRLTTAPRIIEVTRAVGSVVTVTDACDPARRDLEDAYALAHDGKVEAEIHQRVLPGLCRSAVETAARDAWFAHAYAAGTEREKVESEWAAARNQPQRIALALYGNSARSINTWLGNAPHRRPALAVAGPGVHHGVARDPRSAVRDVERMVADLRTGAR
jgi:energy-coupling factor transporter ATP-binding protein EcfA2